MRRLTLSFFFLLAAGALLSGCFEGAVTISTPGVTTGVLWTSGADHSVYSDSALCDAICQELDHCGSAAPDCYDVCLSFSSPTISDMDACLLNAGSFCPAVDSCVPDAMID